MVKMADLLETTDTYSYDPEDADTSNIVLYLATDELMSTTATDPLRKQLGLTLTTETSVNVADDLVNRTSGVASDEEGSQYFMSQPGSIDIGEDPLRGMNFVQLTSPNSKYISKLEINSSRIVPISTETLLPNYKIPVRLYANEETARGDKWWRTLFTGGTYSEETYPSLINTTTVFSDYLFSFANSYSMLYAKSVGLEEETPFINQIKTYYNSYNINVRDYQLWVKNLTSPLLIPAYHIFETLPAIDHDGVDETAPRSGARQLSTPLKMYTAYSGAADIYGVDIDGLYSRLEQINENFTDIKGPQYLESVYYPKLRATSFTEEVKNEVISAQSNLMFSHEYYNEGMSLAGGEYGHGTRASFFPYYNKISFPRHQAGTVAPSLLTARNGLNQEQYFIRDAIQHSRASAKFLETLKDIYENNFPNISFDNVNLNVERSSAVRDTDAERVIEQKVSSQQYKILDLAKLLQLTYNQYSASLNSNYTFVGPPAPTYETTYEDNGLYRYHDNQNLAGALGDVFKKIKDKYQFPQAVWSWSDQWTEISTAADGTITGADLDETAAIMKFLFNPGFCHSEAITYRVEKTGGEVSGDYNTQNVIQNFWIFNSSEADSELNFYDTQVKYGENYTYKCYAYVAVLGKRYRYGDFRLTKQISILDAGMDGEGEAWAPHIAPDGNPDYYCVQFYDPITGQLADQFFNEGTGIKTVLDYGKYEPWQEFARSGQDAEDPSLATPTPRLNSDYFTSDASSLSQRNKYATNQQDLTTHPHMADFMLYMEPCVKLIEIPLFEKTIKVLDNPANDMITIPFQYMDSSRRIGFNLRYESFNSQRYYPISLTNKDVQMQADYMNSQDMAANEKIAKESLSQPRYVEVYRTADKPTSFLDFEGKLIDTIDLKIEDSYYTFPDPVYNSKIPTNQKHYYIFRFVNENLVPGHLSQILECQLIDDGDYIYSIFNVLADELSEEPVFTEPNKVLKKIFQLQPNISQLTLDTTNVNYSNGSREEVNNLIIGTADQLIWDGKVFKIRLTSKKTGKQIDLNVKYELKEEDRINIERGSYVVLETSEESVTEQLDEWSRRNSFLRPGVDCVIATHAVASGGFTPDVKARAVEWCTKHLHGTWYGEAWRRGYRYYGQKAIDEGRAPERYKEFRDAVDFATGHKRTLHGAWSFARRTIQFFFKGLFIKE
jgi:hypothetical protein